MATIAKDRTRYDRDPVFFTIMAFAIAIAIVGGFGSWAARGYVDIPRVPFWVHLHALVFVSWVGLYVTQNLLVLRGAMALHRRMGWIAAAVACAMLPLGAVATVMSVHLGRVPPFFEPSFFLALGTMDLVTFATLTSAAIALRRRTEWHRRLMLCGTIVLLEPAWGRLLPMPALGPLGGFAILGVQLLYVAAGVGYDLKARGRIHPAYFWGAGALIASTLAMPLLGFSAPYVALAKMLAPH